MKKVLLLGAGVAVVLLPCTPPTKTSVGAEAKVPRLDRAEPQAWVGLFTDLVSTAPTEGQHALIDSAYTLQNRWVSRPKEPAAVDAAAWLARARELGAGPRATLPLVAVECRGPNTRVAADQRPLPLARGLEQPVLAEVRNPGAEAAYLRVSTTGASRPRRTGGMRRGPSDEKGTSRASTEMA